MDTQITDAFNLVNKEIKKEYKSLRNRLLSILLDHDFITDKVIATFPQYPIVPNERCGLWYCDPQTFEQTSYFKSTDGHINQWDFSTRRLNMHLLPTIARCGGITIVDSTRRGKKIPDALSKTVPIWCAVLNTLLLEAQGLEGEVLFCPPNTVTPSEFDRIKQKIPSLVTKLKQLNIVSGEEICETLGGKLLRPFWVYPGSSMLESHIDIFTGETIPSFTWESSDQEKILPIVLCTASYQCQDGVDKRHGYTYVQGAADDHELWAQGLTPTLFWENIDSFKDSQIPEQALVELVNERIAAKKNWKPNTCPEIDQIIDYDEITHELHLGHLAGNIQLNDNVILGLGKKYSLIIFLSESLKIANIDDYPYIRHYTLESGSKKSARELRVKLNEICPLIKLSLRNPLPILVCCSTGKDISVGVILAALCENYEEDWSLCEPHSVSKIIIRKHLTKIITKLDGRNVNPSRATLNSVNAYLM